MTQLVKKESFGISLAWAKLTATGLVQTRKPTFEEWAALFDVLAYMEKGVQFAIGDAMLIGEREFGDVAFQKYDKDTRDTLRRVAEKFPAPRRRGALSFSHHEAVAALPPDEQDFYLDKAEQEGWTRAQLRKELGHKAHVGYNSGNNEWYTPVEYIEAARQAMGGIDLDPASNNEAQKSIKAKTFYSKENDGLAKKWKGRIWMNPPYSQPLIEHFSKKLVESYQSGAVTSACVLVNNATETAWFQTLLSAARAVCFPQRRIKFWSTDRESDTPLQGQAVLYFGPSASPFQLAFARFGSVSPWLPVLDVSARAAA